MYTYNVTQNQDVADVQILPKHNAVKIRRRRQENYIYELCTQAAIMVLD